MKLIERVILKGEPVSKVCLEAGISRTLFYRWLRRYKKEGLVMPKKRAKVAPRRVSEENVLEILRLVLAHPEWSSQKVSLFLPKIDDKPVVGNHGVQNVLLRLDLNTLGKRKNFAEKARSLELKEALKVARGETRIEEKIVRPASKPIQLTPAQRLEMIERAIKYGEPVAKVCRDFEVSRPVFYKWLKRYLSVPKEERREILQDKKPKVERYYRQIPEKYEQVVLSVVAQYPEFGVARIVQALPIIAGKPLVGHHGVQNVLRRNSLNTYEKRLAYAQAQITPVTRLISRFVEFGTQFIVLPAPTRARIIRLASVTFSVAFSTVVALGVIGYFATISAAAPPVTRIGLFFATIALGVGSIFFAYSLKYYLTLALVLSFSRQPLEEAMPALPGRQAGGRQGGGYGIGLNGGISDRRNGNGGNWLQRIFGLGNGNGEAVRQGYGGQGGGLQPSLDHIKLKRYPFVSIHLPFYNEKKVVERILKACTSMDYPGDCYEVIVCDDSTDETTAIVCRFAQQWNSKPKTQNLPAGRQGLKPVIKVLHRPTREGFKGGALKYAVEKMDPRTEFCVVFDADFIPYPDTLELFIKYFKTNNNNKENYAKSNIAVVSGYQWHVLNKSENWVTRGVRTEYAGSYVIERPGREILGLLKQISGAVYMIRADVLKKLGWGTSITEDFQLTLRLYEQGYKVVYTPYVQAPAECVSTINRLIRQRMRWAEGHSNNIRRMFIRLMFGHWEKGRKWVFSPLTLTEKLELLYISPYYLQAFFFLLGTFSWLLAETVFPARLPFWTSLWGWSLVLTNFFSLPLVNAVGLFLEESEEKDYLGLLSFVALSYILVPFQAYASVKGFIEKQEGPWFRTPKTGRITDVFTRGRFYRWIAGILPGRRPAPAVAAVQAREGMTWMGNPYVALATANNQFNNFSIKPKRTYLAGRQVRWVSKAALAILLSISITLASMARNVPEAQASIGTGNGHDGDKIVNGSDSGSFTSVAITAISGAGQGDETLITVSDTTGMVGDQDDLLVVQMEGTGAGNWETCSIASVGVGTVNCSAALTKTYQASGAQVVIIPQYSSVKVCGGSTGDGCTSAGTFTTTAYSTTGGIVAFRSQGTVTIESGGTLGANAVGFGGGTAGTAGSSGSSEGAGGTGGTGGTGSGTGGGTGGVKGGDGGGAGDKGRDSGFGGGGGGGAAGGGGGGSYQTAGTAGSAGGSATGGDGGGTTGNGGAGGVGTGGNAGSTYGDANLNTSMYFGSGGGGGGGGNGGGGGKVTGAEGGAGGAGGIGGGIVAIWANTISVAGTLASNGGNGNPGSVGGVGNDGAAHYSGGGGGSPGGGGGGGSGGAIFIRAGTVTLGTDFTTATGGSGAAAGANGGNGGTGNGGSAGAGSANSGAGGGAGDATTNAGGGATGTGVAGAGQGGGSGRIYVEYLSISGTTNPAATTTEIPEKLLLFIPLVILLPSLVKIFIGRRKKKYDYVYNLDNQELVLNKKRGIWFSESHRGPPR